MSVVSKPFNGRFLVFQVGCIECGCSSYPIKVCNTLEEAREVENNHPSTWDSEGGDGYVIVIDLTTCKIVDEVDDD